MGVVLQSALLVVTAVLAAAFDLDLLQHNFKDIKRLVNPCFLTWFHFALRRSSHDSMKMSVQCVWPGMTDCCTTLLSAPASPTRMVTHEVRNTPSLSPRSVPLSTRGL